MHTEATVLADHPLVDVPEHDAKAGHAPAAELSVSLSRWPNAAPFALFLSHDVDQIHDRELFRVLADVNHVRRHCVNGENGDVGLALRRIGRSLVRPKPATRDFETVIRMEAGYGFRSTFFLLHDRYWARHGARYSFGCRAIQDIAKLIMTAGSELGVHGGYYRFNSAALYRESIEAVERLFGVRPCGIRNHLLRFSGAETWRAQAEAGFAYDATYGRPNELGLCDAPALPFFASDARLRPLDLVELPLTVMDTTLFRYLKLRGERALEVAWDSIVKVIGLGGMVTLLWHNNYFNEPEYWDWQRTYEALLSRLALRKPWCATGVEINRWWRARAGLVLKPKASGGEPQVFELHASQPINDVVLAVRSSPLPEGVSVIHPRASLKRVDGGYDVCFAHLQVGEIVAVAVETRSNP